jgi:molybdate transport system substrate-binding protein
MNVKRNVATWFGAFVLGLLAACGRESERGAPATQPSAATEPAKTEPVVELTVFAAASLRDACADLAPVFEKERRAKLTFIYGASSVLAQQIVASRKGDVFVSADEAQMDVVERAELLAAGTRSDLLSNQLVVIQPKPRPSGVGAVKTPLGLVDASIAKLSLANPEAVPAGKYAKAWLEKEDLWAKLEARVVPGVDVRAALAAVESGAAQAAIVYATDAAISDKVEVTYHVPLELGPRITYPAAALTTSPNAERAKEFVDYLHGLKARSVFERRGFIVLPSARSGIDADVGYTER